jgi:prepilin-type N-terminal cleavage/methylation domain-containing protein
MNKKRGFTLIELIITMSVMAVIGSEMAFGVTSYYKAVNKYNVQFAENSILGIISNAKQYCREKNKSGYILFNTINNDISFNSEGVRKDYYKMPGKIKLDSISTRNNMIEINNKGIIGGDACTITIEDSYSKHYNITICVGTFYVEIKE